MRRARGTEGRDRGRDASEVEGKIAQFKGLYSRGATDLEGAVAEPVAHVERAVGAVGEEPAHGEGVALERGFVEGGATTHVRHLHHEVASKATPVKELKEHVERCPPGRLRAPPRVDVLLRVAALDGRTSVRLRLWRRGVEERSGAIRSDQERSGAIRSDQERSGAIRSDQERSGAIRSDRVRSGAIRSDRERSGAKPSEATLTCGIRSSSIASVTPGLSHALMRWVEPVALTCARLALAATSARTHSVGPWKAARPRAVSSLKPGLST